jgi:hypothetical protein
VTALFIKKKKKERNNRVLHSDREIMIRMNKEKKGIERKHIIQHIMPLSSLCKCRKVSLFKIPLKAIYSINSPW